MRTVLVVDDEPLVGRSLERRFRHERLRWLHATTPAHGLRVCTEQRPDLVLLDMGFPEIPGERRPSGSPRVNPRAGLDALPDFLALALNVVMFSGLKVGRDAVEAVRRGAIDYLSKAHGADEAELEAVLRKLVAGKLPRRRPAPGARPAESVDGTIARRLRGSSDLMEAVRRRIEKLASKSCSVLVRGETGTGKDVTAQLLHELSGRKGQLVCVNCAAIPQELFESELFGHEAGSFTGAAAQRKGVLELAADGTLLLDEIGDMPLYQQAKLLSALESKIRRVGGERPIPFTGRLVAASHHDLLADVRAGNFRADLYYRLAGVPIELPPLRARPGDILGLAAAILDEVACGLPVALSASKALEGHSWPGNVRELRRTLEGAASVDDDGEVGLDDLSGFLGHERGRDDLVGGAILALTGAGSKLVQAERAAACAALERARGNLSEAARLLGVDRKTLRRLLTGGAASANGRTHP